jgi:low affinity Fe/Cu permease
MSQNNRGAAQVSLMWVIALAVIMLMSLGFAFLQNQALTDTKGFLADARAQTAKADKDLTDLRLKRSEEIRQIGFGTEDGSAISLDALQAGKNEYITRFGLDAGNINDLDDLASPVFAKFSEVTGQRDALQTEVNQLRNDLDARNQASQTAMREKDSTIADLRRQMEDQANTKDGQIVDIERTRDALRDQLRERETEITNLNSLLDQQARDAAGELAIMSQRNAILSSRLNEVARRAETPDGTVLAVSSELGRAWIDRGADDRVTVGMTFEVRNANTNAVKGKLRITAVEAGRSEAAVVSQVDQYDPVRADDIILNAVYDPSRKPIAALLGNGFGKYNANDMRSMLERVGVEVREDVTAETDYLLLGTPFFDEETGDVMNWDSNDAHKAATSLSVAVIPMRDWSQWLGL